jgi:predicted MFS family arabinose efflux permease
VLSRIPDRNIWLIDGAIFLLGLGYGMVLSILAIFLDARGFHESQIGSLAAWFALGIVCFSIPMGSLVRRFSARATLVASLLGYAVAVASFPFLPSYAAMAADRFFDGACSVGVWVSCETILLSRADGRNKAFVTSLYAVSMALGYVFGPLLSKLIVALWSMQWAFVAAGGVAAMASLMVRLRLDPDVALDHAPREPTDAALPANEPASSSFAVFLRIKTSCFGTFAYGYFQASVVPFLPLYLMRHKGITEAQTIVIPAIFGVGMLGFSNVAGRLGDRYGHLLLMRGLAAVGTLMILGFVFLDRYPAMCVAVLIAGASLASISPVSLALQGVITERADLSRSNAVYNVFYAAGMLLGPLASGWIFNTRGGVPMLYHLVGLWSAFIVFTLIFAGDDPAAQRRRAPAPLLP